ncbi:MAG: J domain-containing protein [Armatimonadetes bacterium]|nr:J domain-containing protein [Armatimonadota bacterium]
MAKDYYKILSVDRRADDKAIKAAYRRLARKYHPDLNPNDPTAEAKFKQASEAYAVLSDPEKRKKYDTLGSNWEQLQNVGERVSDRFQTGFGGGFDTIFEQIFSQMSGEEPGPQVRQVPPRDVSRDVEVTLEEIDTGTDRKLTYTTADACNHCRGAGSVRTGDRHRSACPACRGSGTQSRTQSVKVKIPAGVSEGKKLRVPGKGAAGSNGQSGDLYVVIREAKHKKFRRVGEDTEVEIVVPYVLAALGGQTEVPTIRGTVSMKIPAGTQSGQVFRLANQGITKLGGSRGNLRARVKISVPKRLSKKERALLKEISDLTKQNK